MQLETLLQNAGLEKDVHYEIQDTGRNDEGKLLRPDFLVKLPDDRLVVVDSKVSLTAYANWTGAEDKDTRTTAMKAHYASMERHVRELGDKGYQDLYGTSPDFVLMYIPVEPALSIDFDRQNALYQMAAGIPEGGARLPRPSSPHCVINWKQESQRDAMQKPSPSGPASAQKVQRIPERHPESGRPTRPGTSLPPRHAMQKLSRGPGNLISQAEKLRKLGSIEAPLAASATDVDRPRIDVPFLPSPDSNGPTPHEAEPDSSPNLPPS